MIEGEASGAITIACVFILVALTGYETFWLRMR